MENGSIYFSPEFMNCLAMYIHDFEYGKRTAEEYTGSVRVLCAYFKKDFLDITPENATEFFNYIKNRIEQKTLSISTYNGRLSCYKNLATYIASNYPDLCYENPFVFIKPIPYKARIKSTNVPTLKDIDALLTACSYYPMYYLIFSLALRAALSSSDIISLRLSYIVQDGENVSIVFPEQRTIVLPEDVGTLLKNYIKTMIHCDADGHLFYNKYGRPLSLRSLDDIVKKMVKKSGVDGKYTLKDFRTRAILDMVRVSADDDVALEKVTEYADIGQLRLGHYKDAKNLADNCPANYVNLRVKSFERENSVT